MEEDLRPGIKYKQKESFSVQIFFESLKLCFIISKEQPEILSASHKAPWSNHRNEQVSMFFGFGIGATV